jgi:hypothetical protein
MRSGFLVFVSRLATGRVQVKYVRAMHLCAQKIAKTHPSVRTTQPSIESNVWSLEAYGKSIHQNHLPYTAYISESYQQLSSSYLVQVQA